MSEQEKINLADQVIDAVADLEPDDVFLESVLEEWAENNGYVKKEN